MARIPSFQRTYPDTGPLKIFFDGGLNSKFEATLIEDNQSPDCLNCIFTNGSVETRGGTTPLNTAAAGAWAFDGLYTRTDANGNETMVGFGGGSGWQLTGTSFVTIPSAQSVFTAGFRVSCAQMENYLFAGNGGVIPYKYNGSNWTRHGTYPPATGTVTSIATGVLTGQYVYKYSYVNSSAVEGNVSPPSSTFTATSGNLQLLIANAPISFGVNSKRIYRTTAGGTAFNLVGIINDNTTTTFSDNNADGTLTTLAPLDQSPPPNYSVVVQHPGQNRLFMLDPSNQNFVWYTEANNPYVVKASSFQRFGDKASDILLGLIPYQNTMQVFGKRKNYIYYFPSTDPTTWIVMPTRVNYGSFSPYGLVEYDNGILFPATENSKIVGMVHLQGQVAEASTINLSISDISSDKLSNPIEPEIFNIQQAYLGNITAFTFQNRIYFSITSGQGNTANNRLLVYDFSYVGVRKGSRPSWCPWDGINATQFCAYGGKLYYASSLANGTVFQMNTGNYNDNGNAINSYLYTKQFYGFSKDANLWKDFRYVNILIDQPGQYYMDFRYLLDSDRGSGLIQQIDLSPDSEIWGTMIWGVDIWGGGSNQRDATVDLGSAAGKRIQFQFSNQNVVNQKFEVHYMSFVYNIKGTRITVG